MTYTTHTTLAAIRASSPCKSGWTTLLAHLGKTEADDEQLPILTVLDACGLDDCLWVIDRAVGDDRLIRHLRAAFAEQVLHIYEAVHPGDNRIRHQIETLRNDDATPEQRDASQDGAQNARTAAWAAWAAGAAGAALAAGAAGAADAAECAADAALEAQADERAEQEVILRKMLTEEPTE